MCRTIRLLLILFSLSLAGIAWSAEQVIIQVNGLSGDIAKNVTQSLKNQRTEIIKPINLAGIQQFYKKDALRAIREAMQPYGYFHPSITSTLTKKGNQWIMTFNITSQGPPVRITQVNIDIIGAGKNDRAYKRLYKHVPIKVGDILETNNYEKTNQLLYDVSSTRGYFDAKMLHTKIYINLKNNTASINIKFATGSRYYFGKTSFTNTPFNQSFLRRFLHYKEGQPYNYHKIERTQKDFTNSNYFSQVIIKPEIDKKKNLIMPIKVNIIPQKRFVYTLGAGYGTDTGIRGTFGFDVRRVNKYGHQFKTLIQGARNNSYANATYLIPGRKPTSDIWGLSAGYANFNQVTGTGQSFKLQGSYTTAVGKKWSQTIALTYLNERYNIVGFPFTRSNVLYPNISWQYFSTHNQVNPHNGFSFSGFLGGTPNIGLSDTSFLQARVNAKLLFTLFQSTRFIFRTAVAHTSIKEIQSLPFSLQLFAGGARSIRGYSYNQIGPGRNLLIGSVELQQRIVGNWYIVGFIDAGNVSNNDLFKDLNIGVGPGIAWLSPVGVLEITIANAITQPNKPWVIQFTMGPEL